MIMTIGGGSKTVSSHPLPPPPFCNAVLFSIALPP